MTGPDEPSPREPDGGTTAEPAEAPPPSRPGTGTFTIEGRRAPGLFVVGWLAFLSGVVLLVIGASSGGTPGLVMLLIGLGLLAIGLIAGAGSQAIERAARGVAGYVGPSPFLVFAAVIPVLLLVGSLVGVPLDALGVDPSSPLGTLIGLLVTAAVYLGLVRLLVVGTGSLSWAEMGVRSPGAGSLPELTYGAAIGIPLVFLTGLLAAALSTVLSVPDSPLPPGGDVAGAVLNLVSAAIIAPIAEEIFFRGFSTTAWLRALGEQSAIIRGGLFFAAAHVLTVGGDSFGEGAERALFAFLVRLPVAFALGWVFVRRRSLYASIGLHSSFNGIPALLLLFGVGSG